MPTVVTGASGHVGACLVRALLARGREVRALDLEPGIALEGLDIEIRTGDVRDAAFLDDAVQGAEAVFHLASVISTSGDKGGLVSSVNVDGARNVARATKAAGCRLVHFSSIHAYDIDTHGAPVTEATRPATANSSSAYNCSKARGQAAVLEMVADGLDAVVVNPCGVIGPYDYKPSRMGKFFRMIARGKNQKVGPSGFNWVDVRDVVDGALLAETQGRAGEAYILAGHWVSNVELGQISSRITGQPVPADPIPLWFLRVLVATSPLLRALGQKPPVTREALEALLANPEMSHEKATRELGYSPRTTEDTLQAIFDWYAAEGVLEREKAERAARRAAKQAANA